MNQQQDPIRMLSVALDAFEFVDLSQTIETNMPKWINHAGVEVEKLYSHEKNGFYNQGLRMTEHSGTHVDAPAHTQAQLIMNTVDKIGTGFLIAPAVVYDMRKLALGAGESATAEDLISLEQEMGEQVAENQIALLCFGWDMYWDKNDYTLFYSLNEPGLDESAVNLLITRKVRAVGCDTIACDTPMRNGITLAKGYGHTNWLKNNILIMENLANLWQLPSRCFFMALPLKIKDGSGSPIRPVALIPKYN